jgi:hypothetical protein
MSKNSSLMQMNDANSPHVCGGSVNKKKLSDFVAKRGGAPLITASAELTGPTSSRSPATKRFSDVTRSYAGKGVVRDNW